MMRNMREAPPELANGLARLSNCSSSSVLSPRAAEEYAAESPMVPPPITMMSQLVPDGGGVTLWRGSRWDAGLVAMVPRSQLHVIGMNALERGSLEILREHRFRGAQRALHPALVERIGLAADEDSVVAGHRHRIEHA